MWVISGFRSPIVFNYTLQICTFLDRLFNVVIKLQGRGAGADWCMGITFPQWAGGSMGQCVRPWEKEKEQMSVVRMNRLLFCMTSRWVSS